MPDISIINNESIPARIDRARGLYPTRQKRPYLGMSKIGDPCERRLWLSYHVEKQPGISNRLLRVFDMGEIIEKRLIRQLEYSGYKIQMIQAEYSDFGGKFQGHCDGHIRGLYESEKWHILEIKSANQSSFNGFVKHGIQHNKMFGEKYYAQVQLYMHYSGLKRAIIVVENKNNSRLYQERFRYCREDALRLCEKAERVINAEYPANGISRKKTFWICRMCRYNNPDYCRKKWEGEAFF